MRFYLFIFKLKKKKKKYVKDKGSPTKLENPLCPEMLKNPGKVRFSGEILIWAALNIFLHFFLLLAIKQKQNTQNQKKKKKSTTTKKRKQINAETTNH